MSNETNEITTITLFRPTKDRIDGFKIHPRQSYDETLNAMMDQLEPNGRVSTDAPDGILVHNKDEEAKARRIVEGKD